MLATKPHSFLLLPHGPNVCNNSYTHAQIARGVWSVPPTTSNIFRMGWTTLMWFFVS